MTSYNFNNCNSLSQLLSHQAKNSTSGLGHFSNPTNNDFCFSSYADLLAAAHSILGGLKQKGLKSGQKIILILPRPQEFLPAFWACLLGGYIPCPLAQTRGDLEQQSHYFNNLAAYLEQPYLITTAEIQAELPPIENLTVVDLASLQNSPPPRDYDTFQAKPDDLALLVLTSGSTGNTKLVMLTHGNLLASMAGKLEMQRLTARDVSLNWVSFDHVAALIECHLFPLYAGATQLHVEPQFILDFPLRFLEIISKQQVTMTFTPNFLLAQINKYLLQAGSLSLNLAPLRMIICGGEAIVVNTGSLFLELLAPFGLAKSALWPAFGMTETCAGSIYSKTFPEDDAGSEFASLGLPIQGMQMRIMNENEPLSDGETGELQVSGAMIFQGYFNNPAVTEASFTEDGWFQTGDRGFISNGSLTLTGRSKDSIIINGVNYYSHELETVINEIEGVEKSYTAAFPTRFKGDDTERLAVLFATSIPFEDQADLYRLIVSIRNRIIFLAGFRPAFILPIGKADFPKTSLGKILRMQLRKKFENGGFSEQQNLVTDLMIAALGDYVAPGSTAEKLLIDIYAELFELDAKEISITNSFFELGGTSLDVLHLKVEVEKRFNRENIPILWFLQYQTPQELARQLEINNQQFLTAYHPIVPLQLTGNKTPLFCVHPGVGEILVFVNLAKYFANERPFYALRARGFNEGEAFFNHFSEMVDCYVHAIQSRQPKGPYLVAGYSYGGAVAFEIAKVLEAKGERVAFVGIFNLPPHIKYRMDELNYTEGMLNLAFFLGLIKQEQIPALSNSLHTKPKQEQIAYIINLSSPNRLKELDLDNRKFAAWAELSQSLLKMGREYQPSGKVTSLSVFYAIPLSGTKEDWLNKQLKAWDNFSHNPNRYIDVPGEHYTLMGAKYVSSFQAILRKEIALAENKAASAL